MKKKLETLLLTVLIVIFGVGGYKLGSKKEKIEVIAAAPAASNAKEYGLPTASDIQPAVEPIAPSLTTSKAVPAQPAPSPVAAAKPVAKPVVKAAPSSPAPQPVAAAQPVVQAPAATPQPEPQPSTQAS